MQPILLHLLAAGLYLALAGLFWGKSEQRKDPRHNLSRVERALMLVALFAHGFGLHAAMFADAGQMRFSFSLAVSMMLWLAVAFYWIESFYARLNSLYALVLPAGLIGSLLPILLPGHYELVNAASPAFRAHFIVAMLAYSLFTLAALHAMLMAVAERQLHRGKISRSISNLPPLLTMEAMLFRLIAIAFVLLTLTVGSGIVFSETLFGKAFRLDHKTVFAIISWLLFGGLLLGRQLWGWRGRKALRWTLAGFFALLLAYLGSRFVLEVLLHRTA